MTDKSNVVRLVWNNRHKTRKCNDEGIGPMYCDAEYLRIRIDELESALNQIYAIAGEDPQIAKIYNDVIQPF